MKSEAKLTGVIGMRLITRKIKSSVCGVRGLNLCKRLSWEATDALQEHAHKAAEVTDALHGVVSLPSSRDKLLPRMLSHLRPFVPAHGQARGSEAAGHRMRVSFSSRTLVLNTFRPLVGVSSFQGTQQSRCLLPLTGNVVFSS
jgi:hypothetical protein